VDVGVEGRFVGIVQTADVAHFTLAKASVKANGIALLADFYGGVDEDLEKVGKLLPDGIACGTLRRH